MASAGSGLVAVQQGVFEPLFPRAAMPALPRPSALPPLPGDDPVAQSAARERAAREEGRAAGFREGVAQGAREAGEAAAARLAAALADMQEAFSRLRDAYRERLDEHARESERVIVALAERLAAPGARDAIEALFRSHVLEALRAGTRTGGRLVLSPRTLEILQGDGGGLSALLEAQGVEVVARGGTGELRSSLEAPSGGAIVVDYDRLLVALRGATEVK
jgi:hypothetical protein